MNVRAGAVIPLDGCVVVHREERCGRAQVSLPGGLVRQSETLTDATLRQVREVSGLAVWIERLLYVVETVDRYNVHDLNVIFLARPVEPVLPPDGIDLLKLRHRHVRKLMPPIGDQLVRDSRMGWSTAPRWLGNVGPFAARV